MTLIAITSCAAAALCGCRCVDDGGSRGAGSGSAKPGSAVAPPRALGVLELSFSGVGDDPVGCQLHIIDTPVAGGELRRELQVDLGTTRRRTFFLKRAGYWRLPARFGYTGPAGPDRIELHTTVDGAHGMSVRRPPAKRFVRRRLRASAARWPARWGIACVLRKRDGAGAIIDAAFLDADKRPRVYGVRRVGAHDLTPSAVRAFLRRMVGVK
ncbi:MAG: hypothetical protein KC503_39075 [Myxococcales bacterium]|nr:hypothetical protein [Myxococcales bacterium]